MRNSCSVALDQVLRKELASLQYSTLKKEKYTQFYIQFIITIVRQHKPIKIYNSLLTKSLQGLNNV